MTYFGIFMLLRETSGKTMTLGKYLLPPTYLQLSLDLIALNIGEARQTKGTKWRS